MGSAPGQRLSYDDLADASEGGTRYELLHGELLVTPSPTPIHQRISKRLQRQLEAFFEDRGIGEVFNAPIDLILTRHDVFVPDIVVVTDPRHITKRAIETPPELVVEILSPSTRRRDRGVKANRYAQLGVRHYWIVDPDRRKLQGYELTDGAYRQVIEAEGDQTLKHPAWAGLAIELAPLWR